MFCYNYFSDQIVIDINYRFYFLICELHICVKEILSVLI